MSDTNSHKTIRFTGAELLALELALSVRVTMLKTRIDMLGENEIRKAHLEATESALALVQAEPMKVCGGDGIGNTWCDNPQPKATRHGATWMDWTCASCGGTGRSTWE